MPRNSSSPRASRRATHQTSSDPSASKGAGLFKGQWHDLDPQIAKFKPNLTNLDDQLLKFYKESQGGEGLPYAVFPSFLTINKELFDEAKLPYPPTKVGERYQGKVWDWNALRTLAMKLTIDANGKSADQAGFDPKKIVQYGYEPQWNTSMQSLGTSFGASSLVDAKNNAQIPAAWGAAWRFFYKAIWKDHFMATNEVKGSDEFGKGNAYNSGKFAIGHTHLWYTCCMDAPPAGKVKSFTQAVMPSYLGKTTAKLHADTFRIPKQSKVKDEAFQAMWWLMQQPDLLETYGAFPANDKLQANFKASIDKKFAPNKINWQVVTDALKLVDNPSHENPVPNFLKAKDILAKYETKLFSIPNLNIDKEIADLKGELQRAYDEKK
ncbi:MAG: sugar ABC transporter substrate-binding protein [Pleurocapsa sp. SU_196_0]|nr:sugar ABC transporter substrate-binding protein [Pleurocapsa sp. SU_196_0]